MDRTTALRWRSSRVRCNLHPNLSAFSYGQMGLLIGQMVGSTTSALKRSEVMGLCPARPCCNLSWDILTILMGGGKSTGSHQASPTASATDFGLSHFKRFPKMVSMPMTRWTRDRGATSPGNLVNLIDPIITSSRNYMPWMGRHNTPWILTELPHFLKREELPRITVTCAPVSKRARKSWLLCGIQWTMRVVYVWLSPGSGTSSRELPSS